MHDETYIEMLADRAHLAVARPVPVPFAAAIAAAVTVTRPAVTPNAVAPIAITSIDRRWLRDETGPFGRSDLAAARANGRLSTGRRTVSVELELAPWDDKVTELVLRPDVRAPHRWSGRRRRRWYAAAHVAADALRQQLLDAQPTTRRRQLFMDESVTRQRLAG